MAVKPVPTPWIDTRGPARLTHVEDAPEIEISEDDLEQDEDGDGFHIKTPTTDASKAPAQALLGKIEDKDGALQMAYDFASIPVKVSVREPDKKHPDGVVVQVGTDKPHKASAIELLTINELAQRSLEALGKDSSPEAVIQRDRLEATILLVGQEARAQFDVNGKLPVTPQSRDAIQSDLASAMVVLHPPKNVDEAFNKLVSSASGQALVRRHTDNVMAWNMKWDLVTKPEKTFDFSYFSIERDPYGYAYLGALLALRMRDVEVNGITDFASNSTGHGFSMAGVGLDYMQEVAKAGANIYFYNKPGNRAKELFKNGLTFGVVSSDHDKLAVADKGTAKAEGETGGRNVAGAYHQDPKDNPKSWRDDSVQIRGQAVTDGLVKALDREIASSAVSKVKPDGIDFSTHGTELLMSFQLMETWIRQKPLTAAEKAAVRADPAKRQALADQLFADAETRLRSMQAPDAMRGKAFSKSEMKALKERAFELANDLELRGSRGGYDKLDGYTSAEVKILDQVGAASAAPGARFNEIGPDLLQLIKGAQQHIVVQNPYVVMTEPMMNAFIDASKRGVRIDFVTNSPESTDSALTQGFFLNDWKGFLERVPTARILVATGERKFHAKVFVIDGKVSADTSYNADFISGLVNGEVGAVTRSPAFAQNLLDEVQKDLDDPANKFREWSIQRDANGAAVHGADGKPVSEFGPENDVNPKLLKRYKPVQLAVKMATRMALLSSLRHPDK